MFLILLKTTAIFSITNIDKIQYRFIISINNQLTEMFNNIDESEKKNIRYTKNNLITLNYIKRITKTYS